MSNISGINVNQSTCVEHPCESLDFIISSQPKDLSGFSVNRVLPAKNCKMVGPWIFFDHLPEVEFAAGQGVDVRPHPHIGLATVTYLFAGQLLHRDSLGHVETIAPGDINWMTAGSGIVHSERTPPNLRQSPHTLHALQLWIALPDEHETTEPDFSHYDSSAIPCVNLDNITIRVMIGEAYGVVSPVTTFSPTLYCEVRLSAGAELPMPDAKEKAVFVLDGELEINQTPVVAEQMAIIKNPSTPKICAHRDTHCVIIGGDPVGERRIWWNFVASRPELISQAKQAWSNQSFAPVPEEIEYIPLPK